MILGCGRSVEKDATACDVKRLAEALDAADAVFVGAGAGLSTAAGFTYSGPRFEQHFADFRERYGFTNMYSGGFYPYATAEERWAFWSRYVMVNRYDLGANPLYVQLRELLAGRDYFVLTTNVDHQFQLVGFDKQRLFYTQGDYGLFQCSKPCCRETFDNEDAVRAMFEQQRDMRIPSELIPRCPHCGAEMSMNLRADDTFVQDDGWFAAEARYRDFERRHRGMRVLYLELGVGYNTPVIIKYPFWRATLENPQATYACLNMGEALAPKEIAERSICINADLVETLTQLKSALAS
mgnify:FL=1